MENIYRFVGLIAPVNQWFARFRSNFIIPSNWLLIFALGVLVALNVLRLVSHLSASQTPQSVGALLSSPKRPSGFVTLTGRLRTDTPVETRRTPAGVPPRGTFAGRNLLVPLVDRGSSQGLLVRIALDRPDARGEDESVEGSCPIPRALLDSGAELHSGRRSSRAPVHAGRRARPGSIQGSTIGRSSPALIVAFVWRASSETSSSCR